MIDEELISAAKLGQVSLFVGSGLSIGAGLPGWIDLIKPLAERLSLDWTDNPKMVTEDQLLKTTQYFEQEFGRNSLISYLKNKLDSTGVDITINHKLISSLPINILLTTNYDNLIERTYMEAYKAFNVIVEDKEIPFWASQKVQIVKLCGDLSRPASMAVTLNDFNNYQHSRSKIYERLKSTTEVSTLLFVGYSLQDPFLNRMWDNLNFEFGRFRRLGYAIVFDLPDMVLRDLRHRNIIPISIEAKGISKTMALANWLSEFEKRISS